MWLSVILGVSVFGLVVCLFITNTPLVLPVLGVSSWHNSLFFFVSVPCSFMNCLGGLPMPAKQLPTPGPSRWGFLLFLSCTELSTLQGHGFLLICLSSRAVAPLPMAFWERMFEWHHHRDPWSLTMSSVYFMQNWHPNWESKFQTENIFYLIFARNWLTDF